MPDLYLYQYKDKVEDPVETKCQTTDALKKELSDLQIGYDFPRDHLDLFLAYAQKSPIAIRKPWPEDMAALQRRFPCRSEKLTGLGATMRSNVILDEFAKFKNIKEKWEAERDNVKLTIKVKLNLAPSPPTAPKYVKDDSFTNGEWSAEENEQIETLLAWVQARFDEVLNNTAETPVVKETLSGLVGWWYVLTRTIEKKEERANVPVGILLEKKKGEVTRAATCDLKEAFDFSKEGAHVEGYHLYPFQDSLIRQRQKSQWIAVKGFWKDSSLKLAPFAYPDHEVGQSLSQSDSSKEYQTGALDFMSSDKEAIEIVVLESEKQHKNATERIFISGVVSPNKRMTRWDDIKGVSAPFGKAEPNEFGFWFNYFWAEAIEVEGLTHAQKVKIGEVFFSVFEGDKNNYTIRKDFASRDDMFKENVLRQLLLIGFKRVALDPRQQGPYKSPTQLLTAVSPEDSTVNPLNLTTIPVGDKKEPWPIAYRSDSRTYNDLVRSKGFMARAREAQNATYKAFAMDQAWHPFHNPVYNNSLFLRLGAKSRDNCLHTVVSVGSKLHKITHFPILSDTNVFAAQDMNDSFLAAKKLEEWTKKDIEEAWKDRQKVLAVKAKGSNEVVDHLEKYNHIYVFHLKDIKGHDTEAHFKGPDQFPERGLEGVPLDHLLADLRVVQRYWFRGRLELYDLELKHISWVRGVANLIGEEGKNNLEKILRNEIEKAREGLKQEKDLYDKRLTYTDRQKIIRALKERCAGPIFTGAKITLDEEQKKTKKMLLTRFKEDDRFRNLVQGGRMSQSNFQRAFLSDKLNEPELTTKITELTAIEWTELLDKAKSANERV